jgi:hypothetical protein
MANWCLGTGIAPSEWKALTRLERNAIRDEHNRQAKEMKT